MYQIDNASSVATQPVPKVAGTQGWYTNGDSGTGAPPTIVDADQLNFMQGELMNLLFAAGLSGIKTSNTQVLQSIASGAMNYVVDTGTANTYVGALLNGAGVPNANLTLADPLCVRVKVANTNTGASTFNLNGLGARSITLRGSPLTGGEMPAGEYFTLQYDVANSTWHISSPVAVKNSVYTASATGTGTANAQVIATVTPAGYSLAYGNVINFTAGATNTTAATLNVSSTGAITVKKNSGTGLIDLAAGDLTSGNSYSVNYNGTYYVLIASTPVLVGYLTAANNLSDVASAATARANIGAAKSGANTDITSLAGVLIDSTSTVRGNRDRNDQTGSYTLVLADAGKMLIYTSASDGNFTIPPNASVAFPVNTEIEFGQFGVGALTIVAGAGVTLRSRSSLTTLYARYSAASIKQTSTNVWWLIGDLR